MTRDHQALCGQVLDGRYRLDALVAEGGFGVVFRAEHLALKKPVALKVLKGQGLDSERARREATARFRAEAEIVARLEHPAVVRVLDFGVTPAPDGEELFWMALEWAEGKSLHDDLEERRGTPGRAPREVLTLLRPVLAALAKAHAMGLAHRDIKPRNLMVRPDADAGLSGEVPVKILDFGIAKVMSADERALASGETATRSITSAFSLRYAAPEQVSGMRTGPWTDVYQMALVITELLTQRAPYQGRDAAEVHQEIMAPERPTPARFGVDVGAWEPVLARALAFKPADRYPNAKAFLDALEATVTPEGTNPTSRPAAVRATSASAGRRYAAVAATVIVLLAAGGVGLVFVRRSDRTPPDAATPTAVAHPTAPGPTVECTERRERLTRECGWRIGGTFACRPRTTVTVGCDTNCAPALGQYSGDPILRVCADASLCSHAEALVENDDSAACPVGEGFTNAGPRATFVCPESGRFTALVAPYISTAPYTCALAVLGGT
jgi:serine/threonine-protein kinase